MTDRRQKIEELMEGMRSLRRPMALRPMGAGKARITPSQWGALMTIEGRRGSTVKDLSQALGITSSAATQLVDGLAASGYVLREEHAEDRRKVTLVLSPKTKKQVEKMKSEGTKRFLALFEVLNNKEFNQLIALHKKIFERHAKK